MKKKEEKPPIVTTAMLKGLAINSTTIYNLDDPRECESVKCRAYRIPKLFKTHRDRKYSCRVDYMTSTIIVTVKKS